MKRLKIGIVCIIVVYLVRSGPAKSQAAIVRSWGAVSGASEAILPLAALNFARSIYGIFIGSTTNLQLDPVGNRFYCDGRGYVRELRLRSAGIRSLNELP